MDPSHLLQSLLSADSPPSFFTEASMVDEEERQPDKKRRLTAEQLEFLEKSFEVDNKLEPERKNELANDLNLQPRQVAIWFQNRRARFKTKQLQRDYAALKSSFDSLQSRYDLLLHQKDQLQNEVTLLRAKLNLSEGDSNSGMPSSMKSDVFDTESPHSTLQAAYDCSDFSQDDFARSFMDGDFQGGGLETYPAYWISLKMLGGD